MQGSVGDTRPARARADDSGTRRGTARITDDAARTRSERASGPDARGDSKREIHDCPPRTVCVSDDALFDRDTLLLAVVLVVGVAGTGIVRRQLGVWGLNEIGRLVFVLGYLGTVLVVWAGWIRPLDISGPDGETTYHEHDE